MGGAGGAFAPPIIWDFAPIHYLLNNKIPIYCLPLQYRPCHGAESHLAISSGAGLRAGWEPYLWLLGSKSSSGSLAPMDTIFGFGSGSAALAP